MSANDRLPALLRAERRVVPPEAAARLGWNRLAADLAANVAPLPVTMGPLKLGLWLVPKWLLAGFALGLVGAGTIAPLLSPSAALGGANHALVGHALPPARPRAATLRAEPAPDLDPARSPPSVRGALSLAPATAASGAPTSANAPTATTFDAELELISRAKTELDANDLRAARTLLAQHAARFPTGVFAIERDALFALADCQQKPKNENAFQQFAVRHPSSPLLSRLQRACQSATIAARAPGAASSTASFATLANGSAPSGEPTHEPRQGAAE